MKVIYVAGPYRAAHALGIEQNVRRAEAWALAVARAGGLGVCPHTLHRFFYNYPGLEDDIVIPRMLELMGRCDGALFIPGWEQSVGSQGEMRHAVDTLKLPAVAAPLKHADPERDSSLRWLTTWMGTLERRP